MNPSAGSAVVIGAAAPSKLAQEVESEGYFVLESTPNPRRRNAESNARAKTRAAAESPHRYGRRSSELIAEAKVSIKGFSTDP